ncbi:hypothetical protein [Botrimarina hoheduenensis]|uniref:Uncharacterized protein n=1 Tax=Botrimarina hoheduenensis TaxID=2528000 RepID=A0A5C5WD09_9BACT|nr:hypothetical protein [Botrimarina hoheduenensis]TWT48560.1 hypothetical protein Pla111_03330 [Botrimarina hoheduenensis]
MWIPPQNVSNTGPIDRMAPPVSFCRAALAVAIVTVSLSCQFAKLADADTWIDRNTETENAWRQGDQQPHLRVVSQQRRHGVGDTAPDVERIEYVCPPGASAWFWRPVPPAAVIEELQIAVEIHLAEAPVQLAVEIELPRAIDPDTGRPRRLVVRPLESQAWRQSYPAHALELKQADLPRGLQRALRMQALSTAQREMLDGRGAYVVAVGLAAAGAPVPRAFEIREVRLEGRIAPQQYLTDQDAAVPAQASIADAPPTKPLGGRLIGTRVELTAQAFRVDDRDYFARIRRWRNESPERLIALGFNTVWLEKAPTADRLAEFGSRGLRVICPTPADPAGLGDTASAVLAWILPGEVAAAELDSRLVETQRLRSLPEPLQRPILAHPVGDYAAWSRVADGLLIEGQGSRVPGPPWFAERLRKIQAETAPGTPLLAVVALDVDLAVQRQLDALLGDGVAPAWLPPSDIDADIDGALSVGVCGIAFSSTEGLDSPEAAASLATESLASANERLRLIEPWLLGRRDGGFDPARTVYQRDGAELRLRQPTHNRAPALDDSSPTDRTSGYRLSPAGIRPVTSAAIPAASATDDLLFTGDPRVVQSLARYLTPRAPAASERLLRQARLAQENTDSLDTAQRLALRRQLEAADLARARGDHFVCYETATDVLRRVQQAGDERRRLTFAKPYDARQSCPLALLPTTLNEHFRLMQLLAAAPRGLNRLHGGSFEDIDELRRFGWRNENANNNAEEAPAVEIAASSPIHGAHRLRLVGQDSYQGRSARIVSPPIPIAAGELLEITGWVQVEREQSRSAAGLLLTDSLGGPELSLLIGPTANYEPFRLIRGATDSTELTIEFEVIGVARVDIDGVMVRPVTLPTGLAASPGERRR